MGSERLKLYRLDPAYVHELSLHDRRVMTANRCGQEGGRELVGILVPLEGRQYLIPLGAPKPKHDVMKSDRDFSKTLDGDGKLIGVLNYNNMVPVDESAVITSLDIHLLEEDPEEGRAYKELLHDQLHWCNRNRDLIVRRATKLYRIVTHSSASASGLVSRCCDYRVLEGVLDGRH